MSRAPGLVGADLVLALDAGSSRDPVLTGSKAASLASAQVSGLPIIPGFVVTTAAHREFLSSGHAVSRELADQLRPAWSTLTDDGRSALVVRSSSTVEDVGSSSMAGRFRTVLDVRGWDDFLTAVSAVFASAEEVAGSPDPSPMGVLVQRQVSPSRAGVMFGVDPVTGDRTRIVVEAVSGGPDKLVSGRVTAQHYVMARSGRLCSLDEHAAWRVRPTHHQGRLLSPWDLVNLARLARRTHAVFGVPQDVEWAILTDGSLVLLQSRPVTATAAATPADGPVLGPGPLAETFPDPLEQLEVDLWIDPLRDGVAEAMTETGSVSRTTLQRSPIVAVIGGRVAADLELFGYVSHRGRLKALDPRPAFHQLRAAWRIGALRGELPHRCEELVTEADARLTAVDLAGLGGAALLDLLDLTTDLLRRLHHAEVLAGTLLAPEATTAASLALQVLSERTAADLDDGSLVRAHPVLLSLVPPSMTAPLALPPASTSTRSTTGGGLGPREQLRMRVRWTQELSAHVVWALGRLLARQGLLPDAESIVLLTLDDLKELARATTPLPSLHDRRAAEVAGAFGPPVPAQFRLGPDDTPVPVARRGARSRAGVPAGGGRGVGPVCHGSVRRPPSPGDVLVVRDLQPGLAAWLPGLAGLVAETGGTLSHLAILARECGVPTVVAVHDALHRFPPGTALLVDGTSGEVRPVEEELRS